MASSMPQVPVHVIILTGDDEANRKSAERIEQEFAMPGRHKINDTTYLVRHDDISARVAAKAGLDVDSGTSSHKPVEGTAGLVFRLGPPMRYSGFTDRAIWEWLDSVELVSA